MKDFYQMNDQEEPTEESGKKKSLSVFHNHFLCPAEQKYTTIIRINAFLKSDEVE